MTPSSPPADQIIVISAPSGAGKTTIARALLGRHRDWRFSVSATTRPRRDHEEQGRDYHFRTREEFVALVEAGEMVEWEEIFGNLYGTLRSEVERMQSSPDIGAILFDVDVKGALSIRRAFPEAARLVFVAPPSFDVLEARLRRRSTESDEAILRRLDRAAMEMEAAGEFDIVVVNDDLELAITELDSILENAGSPG